MLMVTSLCDQCFFHPCGLVTKLLSLRSQYRGDWFQRMTSLTSESDSNTCAGEERHHLSYYFFSLTTDINRASKNPRVPAAQPDSDKHDDKYVLGVRVLFFCFWLSVNLLSFLVNGYSEGRWPMADVGVHSYLNTKPSSTSRKILYSVLCKNHILSHMQIWYRWVILAAFVFRVHSSVICSFINFF